MPQVPENHNSDPNSHLSAATPGVGAVGRAAITYISLAALQRGVAFLILPFVTHAMSPGEYGAASMITAMSVLLTAVIAMPLIPLIVRASASGREGEPALLRATGMYCYIFLPAGVALIAVAVALLVPQLLGVSGLIWSLELLAVGFQPATSTFATWVARSRADLARFSWLSLTSVLATAVSKLVFVVVLRLGTLGWVASDLISAVLLAILSILLVRLPRARPTPTQLRYALKFTLPLVPHSASLWALTCLSRPAMSAVSTPEQVGLLSFGLNLAMVAGIVLAECNAALLSNYARETFRAPTKATFGAVKAQLTIAFVIPALIGCGLAVAGPWIFDAAYWPAFFVTGILLIGQAAYGLYTIPMNYLTQTAGLPRYSALASGAGAIGILIATMFLGRRYGAVGVAYITAVGYFIMTSIAATLTRTHKLDIAWGSWRSHWPDIGLASAALICSVIALASPLGSTQAITLCGACLVLIVWAVTLAIRPP